MTSGKSCDGGGDRPEGCVAREPRLSWRVEVGASSSEGNMASSSDPDELSSMWLSSGSNCMNMC